MSASTKPGSEVTWQTIEKLADQAERERIEALDEEELDVELRETGISPEEVASIVKRAIDEDREKRARAQAVPPTPPPVGDGAVPQSAKHGQQAQPQRRWSIRSISAAALRWWRRS
jgi:hypothetical protein